MRKPILVVLSVVMLSFALGGCSKCGFWWDEWKSSPAKACKGDFPK